MPLPPLIEIEPLAGPVRATVAVPGSKSITNRALVLAALAAGETELRGALWSEDTQVMVECLQELGFLVNVTPDPAEAANRTITVYGQGGRVPRGGSPSRPLELFVGNAGTAARFLAAMVCLGAGTYRLSGVPRMHDRPQAALFAALRELGYRVESANDRLPAVVHGAGRRPGRCRIRIDESSQFASALLLGSQVGGWEIEVTGENAEESPYVALTIRLIAAFAARAGAFTVEPDCSSGSYFWGAGSVTVARWPQSGWQMDEAFPSYWAALCPEAVLPGPGPHRRGEEPRRPPAKALRREGNVPVLSRRDDLGDSIMTAIALAPLLAEPVRFTELGRLRVQECERVAALRTELSRCGARVEEAGDTLTVWPSKLHGAVIETYADHRMAMCFAILGLKVPGIRLQNPACVRKTFPNFFQKLVAPPPTGLGAGIRDASTGEVLGSESLLAD
jgi:3-phosphoshikimate 1-carboxyvinyltransferase